MKNDCNIVRDLMPLVIDGVASEESTRMVTEHVADCEPCAKVYADYQKSLPEEDAKAEKREFEQAARKIKRRQMNRKSIVILISVLLTVLVLAAGGLLVNHLHNRIVYVSIDTYDVQLLMFAGKNQPIAVYIGLEDVYQSWGHSYEYDFENGKVRIKFDVKKSRLTYPWQENSWIGNAFVDNVQCKFVDGQMTFNSGSGTYIVTEIVLTDEENERTIYRAGDTLPAASDELRAYYWAVSDYNSWRSRRDIGADDLDLNEIDAEIEKRKKNVEELFALVPEFRPE